LLIARNAASRRLSLPCLKKLFRLMRFSCVYIARFGKKRKTPPYLFFSPPSPLPTLPSLTHFLKKRGKFKTNFHAKPVRRVRKGSLGKEVLRMWDSLSFMEA
jgi:hypothetical protein